MGVLGLFANSRAENVTAENNLTDVPSAGSKPHHPLSTHNVNTSIAEGAPATPPTSATAALPVDPNANEAKVKARRFSIRPFGFSGNNKTSSDTKPVLSAVHEQEKRMQATNDFAKRAQMAQMSKSDKRAQQSALVIRSLIVGPTSAAPRITSANAKPQLNALKTQLMQQKSANKLIMQLHALPAHDDATFDHLHHPKIPIHAVCLEHPDEEEHRLHFAKLVQEDLSRDISAGKVAFQGVASAPLDQLSGLFSEMHVVDLVGSSDFGLGQPGNGKGILAGAVPTAETVLRGFKQITPELMALGYATGKAITPDHSGTNTVSKANDDIN